MTHFKSPAANRLKTAKTRFNPLTALRKTSRDFKNDKSGVAAIEFALIAPIMIGIYFGLAEIASAIGVDRRVSHTANVLGDLATQTTEVVNVQVEEIFSAALLTLDLRDISNVTIELSSYDMDTSQSPPVPRLVGIATLNSGSARLPDFDVDTVDSRILNPTSGVVVARIGYSYTPLMLRYTDSNIDLTELFLLKPRRSASVPIGDVPDVPVTCNGSSAANISCSGTI